MSKIKFAIFFMLSAVLLTTGAHAGDKAHQYKPSKKKYQHNGDYGPKALWRFMRHKGFYNIEIDDDRPARYEVEACFKGKKYELKLTPKWRIKDKDYEGRCKLRKHSRYKK